MKTVTYPLPLALNQQFGTAPLGWNILEQYLSNQNDLGQKGTYPDTQEKDYIKYKVHDTKKYDQIITYTFRNNISK